MGNQKTVAVINNGKVKQIYVFEENMFGETFEDFRRKINNGKNFEVTEDKENEERNKKEFKKLLEKQGLTEKDVKLLMSFYRQIKFWKKV